jgi:hypothetical protein
MRSMRRGDEGMMKKALVCFVTIVTILAGMSCSGKTGEESQAAAVGGGENSAAVEATSGSATRGSASVREDGEDSAAPLTASGDWEDIFKFVRDAIRTEPSYFPLKSAEGVQWSRSGNSLEKALLLAQLLQAKDKTVEIVEGELDAEAAQTLLGGIFPPARGFAHKKDVPVSVPSEDPGLVAAVKRHFWVRVENGDDWVDLDPSFPGAEPGKSFAPAKESYDPADETLTASVSFVLDYTEGGSAEPQAVLSWEGGMNDVADKPLSLVLVAEFKAAAASEDEEEGGGAAGGVFGGLGGGSRAKKKPSGQVETFYNAALTVGGDTLEEGQIAAGKKPIAQIGFQVKVESLGEVVSESRRVLYESSGRASEPPLFQRHAILITGSRIPAEAWQDKLGAVTDEGRRADIKSQVAEVRESLKAKKATRETLDASAGLEEKIGPELGHLVNMIFASTSDDQTEQAAAALAVATWYRVPRILVTSFSGTDKSSQTVFDLRQDRVEAVPLPGQALSMKQAFLYGRGVMESALEGKLLEVFSGKPALSTAALLEEAGRNNVPIRMFSKLEKSGLEALGLPDGVMAKMSPALEAGRIIVVPEKSVRWEGRERWGWWDIDPRTMETIGVLDTGLHQAMIQRTILDAEGPMQSKMGAVLGAMVGAIDTYWVLSALILKYGELTKEALLEAKAYMKGIQAVMCPGFEKKVGVSVGMTVVNIEDCFKKEITIFEAEGGISISQGWCAQFAKGFACASTSIINYYLSQFKD